MSFNFGGGANANSGTPNAFGQTTSTTGNLFGGAAKPAAGGLFGNATSGTSSSVANPFGGAAAAGGASSTPSFSFGAKPATTGADASKPSLFGNTTTTTAAPATSGGMFGQKPATSGGMFGGALGGNAASSSSPAGGLFGAKPASGTTTPVGGGGFSFGQAAQPAASSTPTEAPKPSLFGGAGGSFGTSTTPATKPATTGGFSFAASTTPSGTPGTAATKPAEAAKPSLFGGAAPPTSGGLFGGKSADSSAPAPAAGGLFGGGSFGAKPAAAAPTGSEAPKPTLFGNTAAAPASGGLFGAKPADSSAPKSTSAPAAKPLFGAATAAPATTGSEAPKSLFGNAAPAATSGDAAKPAAAPTSLFGTKPAEASKDAVKPAGGLFGGLNKPADDKTPVATTNAPASGGLFGAAKPADSSAPATGGLFGAKPADTSTPVSGGLFGAKPAATDASNAATTTTTTTTTDASKPAAANPAASTVGPPPQMSRLKNRTMDEIITRWASDLTKYQKEFQDQAAKVAAWDRLLIENGDKIQKLYVSTHEAEQASTAVEKQLSVVEGNQAELESWLDAYEQEVDRIAQSQGGSDQLQGPDQERERTYKLAENLQSKLGEMSGSLTTMIQDINDASATITKTNKPDDPVSCFLASSYCCQSHGVNPHPILLEHILTHPQLQQIVKVLNGHLSQLQWIDQNAQALQAKVQAAQKESSQMGSVIGGNERGDPTDEMFRSYLGRR